MTIKVVISAIFVFLFCWSSPVLGNRNNQFLSDEQIKEFELAFERDNAVAPPPMPKNDTKLPFPCLTGGACRDVVEKYGYTCEEHIVTTNDGHILAVQRIPATQSAKLSNSSKTDAGPPPVLLQHGIFMDGVGWMLMETDSLAFYLVDEGFDVWINNARGTQYSRCHRWYDTDEPPYWDFSWQEFTEIDLDATINYVYNYTQQKVHYVGHSTGSLVALAALASNQPAIKRMRSVALLAPVSYLDYLTSIFGRVGADLFLAELGDLVKQREFNPIERVPSLFYAKVCRMFHINCAYGLWFATGPNCCIDHNSFTRFLQHEPQTTSTKNLMHFSQMIRGGGLAKYDYGLFGNMLRYKQAKPPAYNLKKIPKDFPMFIGYGASDGLADIMDVLRMIDDLGGHEVDKLILNFQLFFAHMDFQMAHNAVMNVYRPMVSFFNSN